MYRGDGGLSEETLDKAECPLTLSYVLLIFTDVSFMVMSGCLGIGLLWAYLSSAVEVCREGRGTKGLGSVVVKSVCSDDLN